MSTLEVDKIIPQSGTATQVGENGDTINVPSGATLNINSGATIANNGTATGFDTDTNDKVKVSTNDTTPGFLNGKLVAGTNISLTEGSDGGNETLTVASTAAGTTLSGSTNNTIPTVTGANALAGEANLTFDGSTLGVAGDMTVTKAGDNLKADFSNGVNANFRILTAGTVSQIGPSTASDIVFLSSNAERMRMLAAGGLTFGGDTAAANALDDYEEGTWTGSVNGSSNTNTGVYTKIGNKVYVSIFLRGLNVTSAVSARITGLPFTATNDSNYYTTGSITYNTYASNSDGGNGYFVTNNTYFQMVRVDSTNDATSDIAGNQEIMLAGFYTTDA